MLLYRTDGAWGPGTGANLTAAQVDGNFYDVSSRVQFLELNPTQPVQIAAFTAAGNQLYIQMSDGSVHGPLTLPTVRWFFRGAWMPGVSYAIDDVVVAPDSSTYIVIFSHVSASIFDPNANNGQGQNYYSLLLQTPAAVMPAGGAIGSVLTKNTGNNYDVIWAPVPPPPGGNAGQLLMKFGDADGDAGWNYIGIDGLFDVQLGFNFPLTDGDYLRWSQNAGQWINQPRPIFNVVTASSWAPVVGDEGTFMVLTNGTAVTTIIVPNDSTQNFQIGSELHINQDGTGTVTITGEPGVAILKHASFSSQLLGQYATATVKKTASNEWRLFGLLAGA